MAPVELDLSQKTFVQLGGARKWLCSRPARLCAGRYQTRLRPHVARAIAADLPCIKPMRVPVGGGAVIKLIPGQEASTVSNPDDGDSYFLILNC